MISHLSDNKGDNQLELHSLQQPDREAYDHAFKEYLRLQHDAVSEQNLADRKQVQCETAQRESSRSFARDGGEKQPLNIVSESDVSRDMSDSIPLLILHSHPVTPQ